MGGIIQLQVTGTQDQYLTKKPEVTFFKTLYKRHSVFALESSVVPFQGDVGFGRKCVALMPKSADMMSRAWLQIDLPDLSTFVANPSTATHVVWANNIGLILLQSVELTIGGSKIDKHTPEYMHMMMQLTTPAEKKEALNYMIGRYEDYDPTDPKQKLLRSPHVVCATHVCFLPAHSECPATRPLDNVRCVSQF